MPNNIKEAAYETPPFEELQNTSETKNQPHKKYIFYVRGKPTFIGKEKYIDLSIMGVGTNILGYSNSEVDSAVIKNIKKGNMSTLNCPEEVYLAKKLIEIHSGKSLPRGF